MTVLHMDSLRGTDGRQDGKDSLGTEATLPLRHYTLTEGAAIT